MRGVLVLLFTLWLAIPAAVYGKSGPRPARSSRPSGKSWKYKAPKLVKPKRSDTYIKCVGCARDAHGRIKRSRQAKTLFRRSNPCPATGRTSGPCPGWVIDHIVPLKRGGPDDPGNMQWQTRAAAKAKDRYE